MLVFSTFRKRYGFKFALLHITPISCLCFVYGHSRRVSLISAISVNGIVLFFSQPPNAFAVFSNPFFILW